MSGWYTALNTWFESSDAQAWIPSSQNNTSSSLKYNTELSNKIPKSNVAQQRMSKEIKLENHTPAITPQKEEKFFELPSNSISDQNAWNAYVISNSSNDFLNYWEPDSPCPTEIPVVPKNPETVVFSKLKRNVDIEEELTKQNRFKTELCQSWIGTGTCRYGAKCQYAHGKDELRPIIRHPKYKTEICKTFSTSGQCPYGNRCRFVHQITELRPDTEDAEELDQIQIKLKEINLSLAPDPVFPSPGHSIPTTTSTTVKKGSVLPFLQKLRKQL
jgi:butyrate response factor 1